MSLVNQPPILSGAFAAEGDKNTIPATNDGLAGLASIAKGFPPICQQPLAQGGLPPQRADFNGILNLFSQFLLYSQVGGVFAYNNTLDYQPPCMVADPTSKEVYLCLQENGPGTSAGVQALTQTAYWVSFDPGNFLLQSQLNDPSGVAGLDGNVKLLSQLYDYATQAEAEGGTDNIKPMNALRTKQAIAKLQSANVNWDWTGEGIVLDGFYFKFIGGCLILIWSLTFPAGVNNIPVNFPQPFSGLPLVTTTFLSATNIPTVNTSVSNVTSTSCQINHDVNYAVTINCMAIGLSV